MLEIVLRGVQPEEIALSAAEAGSAGDSRAGAWVETLFRQHYARIVSMLARLTGDRAQAEEIAGDVFHKLSQRPGLRHNRDDVTAWIYRVATNAGLDALRTNSRRRVFGSITISLAPVNRMNSITLSPIGPAPMTSAVSPGCGAPRLTA